MEQAIKDKIINDDQIKKFSAYGFLKNLAFFKPFLLLYLVNNGINFLHLGLLYSVRELIVYIFEIPSGLIADYYGRKNELCLCFIFYIASFVIFFFAKNFNLFLIAMIFFGLGEAFRSGTHKAMILAYIEKKELLAYKTFIYGRTRSFSLLGTALSSIIAILISIYSPSSNYLFIFSILPYLLNLCLIYSYPSYFDNSIKNNSNKNLKSFFNQNSTYFLKDKDLTIALISQSFFQAIIKSLKDIIQPIISGFFISAGFITFFNISNLNNEKIVLGVFYFFISLFSAFASRKSYIFNKWISSQAFLKYSFFSLAVIITSISFSKNNLFLILILFLIFNIISDIRKPIYIDYLDELMSKEFRATVMSIESQMTAFIVIIFAPAFGYLADVFSVYTAFFILGIILLLILGLFAFLNLIRAMINRH